MTERAANSPAADRYAERLSVPLWWWLIIVGLSALLGYELYMAAHRQTWALAAIPLILVLLIWLLLTMGRKQIRVDADGTFYVHRAMLPREVIARGASVPPSARSAAMGRQLDPAAYVVHHAWIKSMVILVLDDPDDPTPYWLVSTRHPDRVLAALELADAAAVPRP